MIPYLVLEAAEGVRAEAGTLVEAIRVSASVALKPGAGVAAGATSLPSRGTPRTVALGGSAVAARTLMLPFPGPSSGGRAPPGVLVPTTVVPSHPAAGLRVAHIAPKTRMAGRVGVAAKVPVAGPETGHAVTGALAIHRVPFCVGAAPHARDATP